MGWTCMEVRRPYRVGHKLETGHKKAKRTTQTAVERQDYEKCIEFGSKRRRRTSSR